jgi:hypothetical protein
LVLRFTAREEIVVVITSKQEVADWREEMMESLTRLTDPLTMLPAEYWEASGSVYGALADNVSEEGLLFFSVRDISVGSRLNVRIFYADEYELDAIKTVCHVVRKNVHIAEDWKG